MHVEFVNIADLKFQVPSSRILEHSADCGRNQVFNAVRKVNKQINLRFQDFPTPAAVVYWFGNESGMNRKLVGRVQRVAFNQPLPRPKRWAVTSVPSTRICADISPPGCIEQKRRMKRPPFRPRLR